MAGCVTTELPCPEAGGIVSGDTFIDTRGDTKSINHGGGFLQLGSTTWNQRKTVKLQVLHPLGMQQPEATWL
jgi:hypothetical protein